MNNTNRFLPFIGKNVIENLTIGMYKDHRFVYREYVQNAADQIDIAKKQNLYQNENEPSIYIQIDTNAKKIVIEDNATGIEKQRALPILGNIALSTKNKYEDKGFRGIGRLGGLGYCEKLTFETSYYGENVKSTMIWDAKKLKELIKDDSVRIGAAELISIITDYSFDNNENVDTHYFKVIMENVTSDVLLNVSQVREYLSMVAPVPFANIFTLKNIIYEKAKEKNIAIDEYNVYVNTDQLYKGYKNYIYNNNAVLDDDTIVNVNFIEDYHNNDLLFWGWYGISKVMHQIPDENKERGIRLRKSNIQIGLENCLDEYHKEFQGNRYFVGEIYAINRELIPNARRDFFIENNECSQFSRKLREIFHNQLYKLYYDFSKKNSAIKTLQELEDLNQKLEDKTIDNATKEELKSKIDKVEKKATIAKKTLTTLENKYSGQVLGNIIKDIKIDIIQQETVEAQPALSIANPEITTKEILTQQEETILKKVYNVLRQNLIKATAEELIQKIDEEVRK